ncbi:MAG: diphosphomevalonate decarboxylase [Rhodanobacter sp.]
MACAQAQPNIALVKYWGKRDAVLNLPASGSLSITLDSLWTRTRVAFEPALLRDELLLDGAEHPPALIRVSACLDLLRARAGSALHARVDTSNNFPTGAGLASSASGFAALVLAGSTALGLMLDRRELSILARRGSGSAARSIFGGFVGMAAGTRADGQDAFATALLDAAQWPLSVVVAVTSRHTKAVGSGAGMERSRRTSPFHEAWLTGAEADLASARHALEQRDFAELAAVSEHSCMKMHAVMLASRPALLYWNGATVECVHAIRALRERDGIPVFFTIDAGPQVKAVCLPSVARQVAAALGAVAGVEQVLTSTLGAAARVLADAEVG